MILLIDDDAVAADAIARTLRETGREVVIAPTVDAGLAALAAETPLAVVLDLVLDRDAATLHAALVKRCIPVLLTSGVEPSRLPEVAGPRGWRYLPKPVEPDALVSAVASLVERSTGEHRAVPSSIVRDADGRVSAVKSTAQVVSETVIDALAIVTLAAELFIVRPSSLWIQGGCILGILLLAGVRAADLVALSRGLPMRGGPAALALALLGAASTRLGGS